LGIVIDDISGCDATFIADYSFNGCGPISNVTETWSFGGTGVVATNTFPSNGTYPVTVTVTFTTADGVVCTATATRNVTITDCGLTCDECINLGIVIDDVSGCEATFIADYSFNNCGPISNVTETWSFGGTGLVATNTFPSNGTFPVTVTVTFTMANGEVCTVTATTNVTITDCFNCNDCINLFGIVTEVDQCDVTAILDYNFNNCGPIQILGHFWDFGEGGGFAAGGVAQTHTYSSNGTFTIRGIVIYRMGNGQVCFRLATTVVNITDCEDDCTTTAPSDLGCQFFGSQLQLVWDPVPNATCYIISIEPSQESCCKPVPSFPPFSLNIPATAFPRVDVPATAGSCFRWRVRACCEDFTFSPWSPFRCQTPDRFCPIVGKPGRGHDPGQAEVSVNTNSVKVFPNPSSNNFNIALNFETAQEVEIRIMDSTGKLVMHRGNQSIDAGEFMEEWNPAADLPNGLYILEVSSKDQILREKLILQR